MATTNVPIFDDVNIKYNIKPANRPHSFGLFGETIFEAQGLLFLVMSLFEMETSPAAQH